MIAGVSNMLIRKKAWIKVMCQDNLDKVRTIALIWFDFKIEILREISYIRQWVRVDTLITSIVHEIFGEIKYSFVHQIIFDFC